jgi:hypothetical protein
MAMAVFCRGLECGLGVMLGGEAYKPQGHNADDVHEDVAAFTEDNGV